LDLDTVQQGLSIAAVGMGLVFAALALIVAAIMLMGRYMRLPASPKPSGSLSVVEVERSQIAAMAAALVASQEGGEASAASVWALDAWAEPASLWQMSHRSWALSRQPTPMGEGGQRL
jgi:Na+-transporting methylmalonyl-CoA/oxaloacetate decarboxylase gamma subunit